MASLLQGPCLELVLRHKVLDTLHTPAENDVSFTMKLDVVLIDAMLVSSWNGASGFELYHYVAESPRKTVATSCQHSSTYFGIDLTTFYRDDYICPVFVASN